MTCLRPPSVGTAEGGPGVRACNPLRWGPPKAVPVCVPATAFSGPHQDHHCLHMHSVVYTMTCTPLFTLGYNYNSCGLTRSALLPDCGSCHLKISDTITPSFTQSLHCLHMHSFVYTCNPLFTLSLHCLHNHSIVYTITPLFTHVFLCLHMQSIVYTITPLFTQPLHCLHYHSIVYTGPPSFTPPPLPLGSQGGGPFNKRMSRANTVRESNLFPVQRGCQRHIIVWGKECCFPQRIETQLRDW